MNMSGSKSPQIVQSADLIKNDSTQSPEHSADDSGVVVSEIEQVSAVIETIKDNAASLSRKQTQWVFAATCYAFGRLKRDFISDIDEELIAIVRNKLNDEPGFHNETLNFGNNHFDDQLETVVRDTWELFLNSEIYPIDIPNHTQQQPQAEQQRHEQNQLKDHDTNGMIKIENGTDKDKEHCQRQQNQSVATDDNNGTSTSLERQKATPNSSTGGDSQVSNELHMITNGDTLGATGQVRKVYLGGLSDDIEETDIREYFREYGNIVDINIVVHKDTGKRRGFAFVEYDDHEPLDKIVAKKFHTIKNRRIEAKKAIPKVEMDARKRINQQQVSLMPNDAMMMAMHPRNPASYHHFWDGLPSSPYGTSSAGHVHHASLHGPPPLAPPPPPPNSNSYHNHLDHHHHHPHAHAHAHAHAHHTHPHVHPHSHHHHHYSSHHYNAAATAAAATHYGSSSGSSAGSWLIHGSGAGAGSGSGRNGLNGYHPGQAGGASGGSAWATSVAASAAAVDSYNRMPVDAVTSAASNGAIGPMRSIGYGQHARSYRPYPSGGSVGGVQRSSRSFK